jgi:transposase
MKNFTIWVGIDDHADSIKVSVFGSVGSEPLERLEVVPDDRGLRQLVRRLRVRGRAVRCVYEAGPCGYELYRYLRQHGIGCEVAAPALTPRRPGQKVKTDRRDADKLARLHRAGELTLIRVPDEEQEALRDLVRAREDAKEDLLRRRHRLSKFLLRHGQRYRQGQNWTQRHWSFIRSIHFDDVHAQAVLEEYVLAIAEQVEQIKRLDSLMGEASRRPEYAEKVGRLKVLRGVATTTALTILSETGDLRRYAGARQLMGATGLVPSEHSSGARRRQGGITKTGNAHLRRVLIEAAWHYRHRPWPGPGIRTRRAGQPETVLAIARKADGRLHQKYRRLVHRGKRPSEAVVAVARELAGFVWAIGQAS